MKCLWVGSDKSTDLAPYPAEREGDCKRRLWRTPAWEMGRILAWLRVFRLICLRDARKACEESQLSITSALYSLPHLSFFLSLSLSVSLSWQEPRAEVWLMPVCSSSERTKEPAHSRERSHHAKTESFDSEERVNFSLAELKVFL